MAWWGVLWKNEISGFWDVRVGKAYKCPQMSTVKVLVHESCELDGVCTWPSWSVHHDIARWLGGEFLWKNEIRGFLDVRVGKAYKCPQMNTMKFLVHESFEFGGVCTWPRLAVHHGIARLLGGEFCEKWNSWFLRCEGWKGLQITPNEYHEILGAQKFWVRRSLHMAKVVGAPRQLDCLVGSFVKKWNSWFLRCECWKGLQMSPNEYCKRLGARKFWIGWSLHWPKLVGAKWHSYMAWWGVLSKNEIRGFWDVRVGKAYKCPQMNTMKFLVHESFEFGGFCTWPRFAVHHGIARLLGGEICEKMKFVVFEMWGLEKPTNVPKWIPVNSWCTKVLSSEGFAHGQGWRCTTA